MPFCQLSSISECDSTIQESLIEIHIDDEAVKHLIHADGQIFGSRAVRFSGNLGKSEAIITAGISYDICC